MKGFLNFLGRTLFLIIYAALACYIGYAIGYRQGICDYQKVIDTFSGSNVEFQGKMPW